MIVRKNLKLSIIIRGAWRLVVFWGALATFCYLAYFRWRIEVIALPFAPIAVMGTALSIFLGFRNSSSYDRWWEARKIWGGIVNTSRTFARQVLSLSAPGSSHEAKRKLIFRHLAWINALRLQLRGQAAKGEYAETICSYIPVAEYDAMREAANKTTHLLLLQAHSISAMTKEGVFDDFRHMQLDNTLTELTSLQGQCERIKHTPLPRQYNYFNLVFMHLFVFLLPFGLLESFENTALPSLIIPFCMATGFVFYIVEGVGRRLEDPFENRITDVPMSALCRTIEIDLKQMLGEANVPQKLEPVDGFLF
jgi:putative membrane protein